MNINESILLELRKLGTDDNVSRMILKAQDIYQVLMESGIPYSDDMPEIFAILAIATRIARDNRKSGGLPLC